MDTSEGDTVGAAAIGALAAPVAVIRDTGDGLLVEVASKGFAEALGLSGGAPFGRSALAAIGLADPSAAAAALRSLALRGGAPLVFDCADRAARLHALHEGVGRVVIELRPTESIVQTRIAALDAVQRTALVERLSDVGNLWLDTDGRVVRADPQAVRLLSPGRDPSGVPLADLAVHGRMSGDARLALEDRLSREAPFDLRLPVVLSEGRQIRLALCCEPVSNVAGRFLGFVVQVRDETRLREAESRVHWKERLLDHALHGGAAAVWRADPVAERVEMAGEVGPVRAGDAPARLDVWIGWLLDAVHPADRAELSGSLHAHFDRDVALDCTVRAGGGRGWRWLRVQAVALSDGSDGPPCSYGTMRDVSALRGPGRSAERVERQKTELFSTVTHELRDTLNGVAGSAQLLSLMDLDPRQQRLADRIVTGCQSILALVDDTLDLARIQAGLVRLHDTAFSPAALCRDVVDAHRGALDAAGLGLHLDVLLREDLRLVGDARRLRQILDVFLSNAVRYTERGSVGLRVERPEGGDLRVSVSDTGPGIPDTARAGIFRRYGTVEVTGGAVTGAGLGLSLAGDLAHLLCARIGVDSRPGAGSTFWVSVPFEDAGNTRPDR